jgi:hypothetical protein
MAPAYVLKRHHYLDATAEVVFDAGQEGMPDWNRSHAAVSETKVQSDVPVRLLSRLAQVVEGSLRSSVLAKDDESCFRKAALGVVEVELMSRKSVRKLCLLAVAEDALVNFVEGYMAEAATGHWALKRPSRPQTGRSGAQTW